jgi:plasmid stability protein
MATLHVRNVPDALYARLRADAEHNGRSIGAETIFRLQAALIGGPTAVALEQRRRRGSTTSTPFEHFSPRARQVVVRAQDAARDFGHSGIGTEHLLLGVLRDRTAPATLMLEAQGLDDAEIRRAVEDHAGRGEASPDDALAFTPGAKKAMELALRESLDGADGVIWPFHLVLGIAREEDGLGARILASHGLDAASLRRAIRRRMSTRLVAGFAKQDFRVLELDGDAAAWEVQLNELTQLGYELVQIVDRRAIFSGGWRGHGVDRGT